MRCGRRRARSGLRLARATCSFSTRTEVCACAVPVCAMRAACARARTCWAALCACVPCCESCVGRGVMLRMCCYAVLVLSRRLRAPRPRHAQLRGALRASLQPPAGARARQPIPTAFASTAPTSAAAAAPSNPPSHPVSNVPPQGCTRVAGACTAASATSTASRAGRRPPSPSTARTPAAAARSATAAAMAADCSRIRSRRVRRGHRYTARARLWARRLHSARSRRAASPCRARAAWPRPPAPRARPPLSSAVSPPAIFIRSAYARHLIF